MNKVGKKARESAKVAREFAKLGIDYCEARISKDCTPRDNLTNAHSLKRRFMGKVGTEERAHNMAEQIKSCLNCHRILDEEMTHEEMRTFVRNRIAQREIAA